MNDNYFKAPWCKALTVITIIGIGLCVMLMMIGFAANPPAYFLIFILLIFILISAFYTVSGYRVTDHTLVIQRLGWSSCFDLSTLTSAYYDPKAMQHSLRVWGNGGFFSFTGWFRNKQLGWYRAFATDPRYSVVLRFTDRTLVITPEQPENFLAEVTRLIEKNKP